MGFWDLVDKSKIQGYAEYEKKRQGNNRDKQSGETFWSLVDTSKIEGYQHPQGQKDESAGKSIQERADFRTQAIMNRWTDSDKQDSYYSQPEEWGKDYETLEAKVKTADAALAEQAKKLQPLQNAVTEAENSLKAMQTQMQQARNAYYKVPTVAGKNAYNALVEEYNAQYTAYSEALSAYNAAYEEAYRPYEEALVSALANYQVYAAQQQQKYDNWKSTVRDTAVVQAELDALNEKIKKIETAATFGENSFLGLLGNAAAAAAMGTVNTTPYRPDEYTAILQQLRQQQALLQEELDWGKWLPYAALAENEDFAEKSRYVSTANGNERSHLEQAQGLYYQQNSPWNDPLYEYINGNQAAGLEIINQAKAKSTGNDFIDAWITLTQSEDRAQTMTESEVKIYNYLYATQGPAAARQFYDSMKSTLNARQREASEKLFAQGAEKLPITSSLLSVAMSPLKGLSYLGQAQDLIADGKIDQNAAYNAFSYIPTAIREEVPKNWGKVGTFAYQTGMSMADFLTTSLVTGGNSAAALAIMGSGAAADTTIAAKDRGLSDGKAFALGTVAGIAEVITEKVSLDALLDADLLKDSVLKYVLKNMVAEGSEEVGSDIINLMADTAIALDESEFNKRIEEYVKDGYSRSEASGMAFAEQAAQMGLDFLGGALSGGVMGGGRGGFYAINTAKASKAIGSMKLNKTEVRELVEQGLVYDKKSAAYQLASKMQQKLERGETPTSKEVAKLVQANTRAAKNEPGKGIVPEEDEQAPREHSKRYEELTAQIKEAFRADDDATADMLIQERESLGEDYDRQVEDALRQVEGVDPTPAAEAAPSPQGEGIGAAIPQSATQTAPFSQGGQELTQDHENGGNYEGYEGNDLSDGSGKRDAGTGAGEQAGGLAEGAGGRAWNESSIKAAAKKRSYFMDVRLDTVSSKSLGLEHGTEERLTTITPIEYMDEALQNYVDDVSERTGKEVVLVSGEIEVRGADGRIWQVRGVRDGERIIAQVDNDNAAAEQIIDHEAYHDISEFFKSVGQDLDAEIKKSILEKFSKEEFDAVLEVYLDNLAGIYAENVQPGSREYREMLRQIQQELLADAYAGINAFGAGADRFTEAVNNRMEELGLGRRVQRQENGTRQTNGPNSQAVENLDGGVRYSISESFSKQLNNWDGITTGFSFVLGNTSDALRQAGIPNKQIRWDATKIKKILEEHSGMTLEVVEGIPELLENPVVVIDSKNNDQARIVMGNLYDANGKVVTAVLLLTPTSKKGNQLDIIKVASAQGRGHIESLFRNTDGTAVNVRYVDKKRIQSWLNANRLQLPLRSFNLDSNNSVSPNMPGVKQQFSVDDSNDMRGEDTTVGGKLRQVAKIMPRGHRINIEEREYRAKQMGYPVIDDVQIVPWVTWVHATDPYNPKDPDSKLRSNYGQVIGRVKDGLVVAFVNKHEQRTDREGNPIEGEEGKKRSDRVIRTKYLHPVQGVYQMTADEEAALMASDPGEQEGPYEATQAELDELYGRASQSELAEADTVPWVQLRRESMPVKAEKAARQAENRLVRGIKKALGVVRFTESLKQAASLLTDEFLENGDISAQSARAIFNTAWDEGIVENREFYEEYQEVQKLIRSTPLTLAEQDQADIADFGDFKKRTRGILKLAKQGGTAVDSFYRELQEMAQELFPDYITHPADQLQRIYEVASEIKVIERSLREEYDKDVDFKLWAWNDFQAAVGRMQAELREAKRYSDDVLAGKAVDEDTPISIEEVEALYPKLKKARRAYEKVLAKTLLTQSDAKKVNALLRGDIAVDMLKPGQDNVAGIKAVYEAKREYENIAKRIQKWNKARKAELRRQAAEYTQTAISWKDKKIGLLYARETQERNIRDIVGDPVLAKQIIDTYFWPVHQAAAETTTLKNEFRARVKKLGLSQKVKKGNRDSEAAAVQMLGEAEDNIRVIREGRGRIKARDGKTLTEWQAVITDLWANNPEMEEAKIREAVGEFRKIYDELFTMMNESRIKNGYEPVNYRQGYFPHFQLTEPDGTFQKFGQALGISLDTLALPTSINGITHTFKPGIQWFGNAQERKGFDTAFDAVEGFDKYIEGVADVIYQTENIQRLRALVSQLRYTTSQDGLKEEVDRIRARDDLSDADKEALIRDAENNKNRQYALNNYVSDLEEYTNLLAGKKSLHDRIKEKDYGRAMYKVVKAMESRVAANMVAINAGSWITNFIPLTQGWATLHTKSLLSGMWKTMQSYKNKDGFAAQSVFLTNRRGSDPLVRSWAEKTSVILSTPMSLIDNFVADSLVRARYKDNLERKMSEQAAMDEADQWVAGVMADRSKGATPTLFNRSNPMTKLFTQFQLEVNNQLSYLFKDIPREKKEQGVRALTWALLKFAIGAWAYNELYEKLFGRRPALDPIGILWDLGEDLADEETRSDAIGNLVENVAENLPFMSAVSLVYPDFESGRIPVSSAIPDFENLEKSLPWVGEKDWSGEKKARTFLKEILKPIYYMLMPFGGGQAKKAVEAVHAVLMGGSYTVDAEGNDILQYPFYTDEGVGSVLEGARAGVFGKTTTGTGQEWIESGFKSLSADATKAYQDMVAAGTAQKDAFQLVDALRKAEKTEEQSKADVQREILKNSEVADEGRQIAYFSLVGTSDSHREKWQKFQAAGLSFDQFLGAMSTDADHYLELVEKMGVDPEKALEIAGKYTEALEAIPKEDGQTTIKDLQRWRAAVDMYTDVDYQLAALSLGMTDAQITKADLANDNGIKPRDYVEYLENRMDFDEDGSGSLNQAEAKAALDSMSWLTKKQKAVLWQLSSKSWTAKNNPYDKTIGQHIIDTWPENEED